MRQFGTALGCCIIGGAVLTLCVFTLPERREKPPWATEAQRSLRLDEAKERSLRFADAIREVDDAVAQGLPLCEGAARLAAAAERIDPDQLRIVDSVERQGRSVIEKIARQIVKRFDMEIRTYGNVNRLPGGLLERLERELDEMVKHGASLGSPLKPAASPDLAAPSVESACPRTFARGAEL